MKQEQALKFKVMSLLLGYPDEGLKKLLPELKEAVHALWPEDHAAFFDPLLQDLDQSSLIRLQEKYTATFDLNPAASLNLTYHRWGDGEERGRALAEMGEIYNRSGWAPASTELPDFLPMILEYLSANGDHPDAALFTEHTDAVEALEARLRESQSRYAGLFSAIGKEMSRGTASRPEPIRPSEKRSGIHLNR